MSRCLVTGATGFIGSHLVDALIAAGHQVVCTTRPQSNLRWLRDCPAELVAVDFTNPASLDAALEGVTEVYHVAGITSARTTEEYVAVNEGLTRAVAEACLRRAEPPRLLYVSSLAAAGPSRDGRGVTEDMQPAPISVYGRSKRAGEVALEELSERLPWVIVRPPVVYGPRDAGLLTVFKLVKLRLLPRIGRNRSLSLVYIDDLIEGLQKAMASPAAARRTYFVAHPEAMSMEKLGERIAAAMGVRALRVPVPDTLIRTGGRLNDLAARLTRTSPPFNGDKAVEMTQSHGWLCDSRRAAEELGFRPVRPHDEALVGTVRWYRANGWL